MNAFSSTKRRAEDYHKVGVLIWRQALQHKTSCLVFVAGIHKQQ
jgi:hypothetical protein